MNKTNFPLIAAGIGLVLALVVITGSATGKASNTFMPLLTLLAIAEFSFIVTLIATYVGVKYIKNEKASTMYKISTIMCAILSMTFLYTGITLWPGYGQ